MKTRKLLFTMIAAMTMVFGLTLTANAEEAAPATKVVGVEGIGTFTVPADWSDAMYIDNYGTFWFNPEKTAYVGMSTTKSFDSGLAPIEVFAPILKKNVEATGVTVIDWQVTKYFEYDAIYSVTVGPEVKAISTNHPAFATGSIECTNTYYARNAVMDAGVGAISVEELQAVLPILATYQPAK